MKYAVARIGGRQFKLEEGQELTVDRTDRKIDQVLLFIDGDDVRIGHPLIEDVKIRTKVVDEGHKKTDVRRFKAKSRYRKKEGHKQPVTKLLIEAIG